MGSLSQAHDAAERWTERAPRDATAWERLGLLRLRRLDRRGALAAPPRARTLSPAAWARLAHALARTDRTAECLAACQRALALGDDPEVHDLLALVLAMAPRELAQESAAAEPFARAARR